MDLQPREQEAAYPHGTAVQEEDSTKQFACTPAKGEQKRGDQRRQGEQHSHEPDDARQQQQAQQQGRQRGRSKQWEGAIPTPEMQGNHYVHPPDPPATSRWKEKRRENLSSISMEME